MRKTPLLILKGIIATSFIVALAVWAHQHIVWQQLLAEWQRITFVELAVVCSLVFLSHFLRIFRVHYAYTKNQPLPFSSVAGVSLVHNTVSFLLPMRLGEAALPILSKAKLDVGVAYSSASLLLIRIFDAHWLLLILLYFAASAYFGETALLISSIVATTVPVVVFAIRYVAMRHRRFESIRPLVSRSRTLIMLYLLTGCIWLIKLSALAFLASALGDIPINHAWIATVIADASALSPITGFANAGTFEAAFSLPLVPLGYDGPSLVKTAINVHILIFATNILAGSAGVLVLLFNKPLKQVK